MKDLRFSTHFLLLPAALGLGVLFAASCGEAPEDAGTGGGRVCTPGQTQSCYEGPAGTEGVGICAPGVSTCNAEGTGYGPCEGQVLPGEESCATPEDDDCDGMANEGCTCTPGEQQACYDGPPGTLDVGACKGGMRTCLPDGSGFGQGCEGQVVPAVEVCGSPVDESCDGIESCVGNPLYSLGFSSDGDEALQIAHIAVTREGRAYVLGHVLDRIVVNGVPIESAGGWDVFLFALDPAGKLLWTKRFGDADDQRGADLAVDAQGNVVLTGTFSGTIDFGEGPLSTTGGFDADVFVAKLDSNGNPLWGKKFGDASPQRGSGIAVNAAGQIFLTGGFSGEIDFGTGALTSAGDSDVFIARLAPDGTAQWSARFGDAAAQAGTRVAADENGGVFVAGDVDGVINLGGGPLASAGATDIFVAHFGASGAHLFSQHYGGAGVDRGGSVAAAGQGAVVVTGFFSSEIDLGSGPVTTTGDFDGFVMKIGADGKTIWARLFGGAGPELATDVAADVANNVIVGGTFAGTMLYPGGATDSAGVEDVFVAKLDPAGSLVWLRRYGDAEKQEGNAVATDGMGDVFFAGRYYGAPDFGGGPLPSPSGVGGFVAKLSP